LALNNITTTKDASSEVITKKWYLNPVIDTVAMESMKARQSA